MKASSDLPRPATAPGGHDAWIYLRCVAVYLPAALLVVGFVVSLLAILFVPTMLVAVLQSLWKMFRRRWRAVRSEAEPRRAETLKSEVLAAVGRVASGRETLPFALMSLSECRQDRAWSVAASELANLATLKLQAERFEEAFVLARFSVALADPVLSEEERLACRRVLIGARLPAGPLARAREVVVRETLARDRRTAPDLWAQTSWWRAERAMAEKSKDWSGMAKVLGSYTAVHGGLAGSGRSDLRAEALWRLAGAWWESRAISRKQTLREEQAICCARRALALLPDEPDVSRAEISRKLGIYWYYRHAGERAQNLEEAIARFGEAAETLRIAGGDFALTQHWLGAAFLNRVRGDRARNLERAIYCFQQTRHVEVSEQVRKRTGELLDRAVNELWGRAAARVAVAGANETPEPAAAEATVDVLGLLPAIPKLEDELAGRRRPWWRWARQFQWLSWMAVLVVFILYFRHPLVWLSAMLLSLGAGTAMLAANDPRVTEQYFHFAFLGVPRAGLELFRAWRAFKRQVGGVLGFLFGVRAFLAQPQSMLRGLREAVAALDKKRFPLLRLGLLQSYGYILQDNPVGEVGESCEEAILHLQSYRDAWRRKGFAFLARLNNRILAEAYLKRRRGNRVENARRALEILRDEVLPYAEFRAGGWERKFWAERKRALFLLGEAYRRVAGAGDGGAPRRAEVEQAVACYSQALACRMPRERERGGSRGPVARLSRGLGKDDWEPLLMDAESCAGLADLWHELEPVDDAASIARRRSLLEAADALVGQAAALATKRTGFAFSGMARKRIEIELRRARLERSAGDARSLASSEALYRRAAGAAMREGFSALVLEALAGLGELFYRAQDDAATIDVLTALIDYQDRVRWQVMSIPRRAELLRESIEDFDRLITSLLRQGRVEEAAVLSERSRSRTLVDLLHLRGVLPHQATAPRRQRLREDMLRLTLLEGEESSDDDRFEVMRKLHDEDLLPLEQEGELLAAAQPLTAEGMKALATRAGAILLLLRVTDERSFVFLVLPDGTIEAVEAPLFTGSDLEVVADIVEQKGARREWEAALEGALAAVSERLLGPVWERLERWQERAAGAPTRLVIVPNRGLAVVPLHACFWEVGGRRRYLIDEFVVSYAPNLSVLARCLERDAVRKEEASLFAIGNPLPSAAPLPSAEWECERIQEVAGMSNSLVSVREAATREEVLERAPAYSCLHFACHASYLTNDPFNSHLLLARDVRLTLGEIVEGVKGMALPKAWLVTLSACETGRLDSREVADESLGLATGFVIAGAATVWCTLWKIDDVPTALLMAKAYQVLFSAGKPKCEALREAQLWLRDLTEAEVLPMIATLRSRHGEAAVPRAIEARTDYRPYAHPASWAAYQSVGA